MVTVTARGSEEDPGFGAELSYLGKQHKQEQEIK